MSTATDSASAARPDAVERAPVKDNNVGSDPAALSRATTDGFKPLSSAKPAEPTSGSFNFDDHPSIFSNQKFGDPSITPERDKQIAALDKSVGAAVRSGLVSPATAFGDAVDTAHNLINAKPGEQQKIFADAAAKFTNDNPQSTGNSFQGVINDALRQSPEPNNLRAAVGGSLGEIIDPRAVSDQNPKGIVASAFLKSGNKDIDDREKLAIDVEPKVAQTLTDARKGLSADQSSAFDDKFSAELEVVTRRGLTAPVKDIGARVPPADLPGFDAQVAALRASEQKIGGTSEKRAQQAVLFANQLAFSEPSQMQSKFTEAIKLMQASNPDAGGQQLAALIRDAATVNKLGGDADTIAIYGDSSEVAYADKRLATTGNPDGNVALATSKQLNVAEAKALDAAIKVGATISDGSRSLPKNTAEMQQDFTLSVMNLYQHLRTD